MPTSAKDTPVSTISTIVQANTSTISAPQTSNALYIGHASSAPMKPPPVQLKESYV